MADVYEVLNKLEIAYSKHDHPAIYTVAEAEKIDQQTDAAATKNLFLTTEKRDKYYLLVIEAKKRADLKEVAKYLNIRKLSFGTPEKLQEFLGLTPGSVSPFGLINDTDKRVEVLVSKTLMEAERIGFHPNINTATLVISTSDFRRFLDSCGNSVRYF